MTDKLFARRITADDMNRIAQEDRNAGRLMAFFLATDDRLDGPSRALMLRAALGFTEDEFERCLAVLEHNGFGRVSWRN